MWYINTHRVSAQQRVVYRLSNSRLPMIITLTMNIIFNNVGLLSIYMPVETFVIFYYRFSLEYGCIFLRMIVLEWDLWDCKSNLAQLSTLSVFNQSPLHTRCKACPIFYHLRPARCTRVASRYNYSRYTHGTISSACQTSETQYYVKSQAIRFLDASLARALREIQVGSIIPTALFQ